MAKQPDNPVLRILKQIQATQAKHRRRFDQVENVKKRLKRLEDKV